MTNLPADWVEVGYGIPKVCARHGERATAVVRTKFVGSPLGWSYLLIPFGWILFALVVDKVRDTVVAEDWPFCDRCQSLRRKRIGWGTAVAVLGAASFVSGIELANTSDRSDSLNIIGLIAMVAGAILGSHGGWTPIANGRLSGDGDWVEVRKADPRFTAEVEAVAAQAKAYEDAEAAPKRAARALALAARAEARGHPAPPQPNLVQQ